MIQRQKSLYIRDFFRRAENFDGYDGNYTQELIDRYNAPKITPLNIERVKFWPHQVIIIQRANLPFIYPCSNETARIVTNALKSWGHSNVHVHVVNDKTDLDTLIATDPQGSIILSQTAEQSVYNYDRAIELEKDSICVVSGSITAPGHFFTDKLWLYETLNQLTNDYTYIAPYQTLGQPVDDENIIAEQIIALVDTYSKAWQTDSFFVKPIRNGGGTKGGFYLKKINDRYFIPNLTYLSGDKDEAYFANYQIIDPDDRKRIDELVWIFRLYERFDEAKHYLEINLNQLRKRYQLTNDPAALKNHLKNSVKIIERYHNRFSNSREEAIERLSTAIRKFQTLTQARYEPIICKYLNCGDWTLRVHLRSSGDQIILESLYARLYPIALLDDGVAFFGTDSLNTPFNQKYEGFRQQPLNRTMLDAIGGKKQLIRNIDHAVLAFRQMMLRVPETERNLIPVRAEFDMAPPEARIIESNADGVLGFSLGTRWESFVRHTEHWLADAINYYAWLNGDAVNQATEINFEFNNKHEPKEN